MESRHFNGERGFAIRVSRKWLGNEFHSYLKAHVSSWENAHVGTTFPLLQALKFSGHLKYLREDGGPEGNPLLALFAVATPLQPPPVMEIRTRTLIFQTKHRMDFAPMAVDTRYTGPDASHPAPPGQTISFNRQWHRNIVDQRVVFVFLLFPTFNFGIVLP